MKLEEFLNTGMLAQHIADGYVTARPHQEHPLVVYNYTPQTQYEQFWDDVTIKCRGLIVDSNTNEIVGRSFTKFFNYAEYDPGDNVFRTPFAVFDKMDGILGVGVYGYGDPFISTRGSFHSDFADVATQIYRQKYMSVNFGPGVTPVFEIIYPEARIVVDYGDTRDLYLLAVIDNETGMDRDDLFDIWPGPKVERFHTDAVSPLEIAHRFERAGAEGIVLRFDYNGHTRIKVKQEDYVRIHKLKFFASLKDLRSAWAEGKAESYIAELPDEIHKEFKEHLSLLNSKLEELEKYVADTVDFASKAGYANRAELAAKIVPMEHSGLLFKAVDGYNPDLRLYIVKHWRKTDA